MKLTITVIILQSHKIKFHSRIEWLNWTKTNVLCCCKIALEKRKVTPNNLSAGLMFRPFFGVDINSWYGKNNLDCSFKCPVDFCGYISILDYILVF